LAATTIGFAAGPSAAATNLNSSRSNIYTAIATAADEQACLNAGGVVVVLDGKRQCQQPGGTGGNEPTEGVTLQCDLNASGDPLKGLNVSKGGGNKGNVECQ
jgi:hypothetical protein